MGRVSIWLHELSHYFLIAKKPPKLFVLRLSHFSGSSLCLKQGTPTTEEGKYMYRELAQLASAHALGAWGCEFESHVPDHFEIRGIRVCASRTRFGRHGATEFLSHIPDHFRNHLALSSIG